MNGGEGSTIRRLERCPYHVVRAMLTRGASDRDSTQSLTPIANLFVSVSLWQHLSPSLEWDQEYFKNDFNHSYIQDIYRLFKNIQNKICMMSTGLFDFNKSQQI